MDWFLYDNDLHHERVKGFWKYTKLLILSRETLQLLMQTSPMLAETLKLFFMFFLCNVYGMKSI